MNTVKIFYKDDCPMCPMAKKLRDSLIKKEIIVSEYNVETADGLAEAAFHDVMALPTIIIEDDNENELNCWRGMVPKVEEIINALKGGE
ncbi:MAG TPA: thioredoxin family protein [Syntrophorhabdaceae bacterium]|nr:thioredoxin family protein [Caldisericia bacterium]HQH42580.1 thioredoxin family protein [Syntrophorhabdaceae bacterium]